MTYISIRWVLVDGTVEVYRIVVDDHVVAQIRERHFVHDIHDHSLDRQMHVLRQMHLVKFLQHLLEAVEEGEAA